ncbi:MAG: hypothetical protein Q9182_004846 [Xanthomendoza sp. 2 TL-2023]
MELQENEKEMLVAAKEAVEANWRNTMWSAISAKMEEMGARKYPSDFLLKEFKKLEATDHVSSGVYAPAAPPALGAGQSAGIKARAAVSNGNGNAKAKGAEEGGSKLLAATAKALAAGSDDETEEEVKEEDEEESEDEATGAGAQE